MLYLDKQMNGGKTLVIFGYDVKVYFLLFMIYAILGWIMEVTCKLVQYKRFINRGQMQADKLHPLSNMHGVLYALACICE